MTKAHSRANRSLPSTVDNCSIGRDESTVRTRSRIKGRKSLTLPSVLPSATRNTIVVLRKCSPPREGRFTRNSSSGTKTGAEGCLRESICALRRFSMRFSSSSFAFFLACHHIQPAAPPPTIMRATTTSAIISGSLLFFGASVDSGPGNAASAVPSAPTWTSPGLDSSAIGTSIRRGYAKRLKDPAPGRL